MDIFDNLVFNYVAVAPTPATSGTSIELLDASRFGDPAIVGSYNISIYPNDTIASFSNTEIVRVTAKSGNTLTIIREQEGTNARSIVAGDRVVLAFTAKKITDMMNYLSSNLINGKVTVSVSSNNLVIAIKTLNDKDPSVKNPVSIFIAGSLRSWTAAASYTLNAGTNYGNIGTTGFAGILQDWNVFIGWNTSNNALRIGLSRLFFADTYADFNTTTTNERWGGFNGVMSSSDPVVRVGRLTAQLSNSGAGHQWSNATLVSLFLNRDSRNSLSSIPRIECRKSSNQTINNVTSTAITWDIEVYKNFITHDNVTNNSRITIQERGIYNIWVNTRWTVTPAANYETAIDILRNGTQLYNIGGQVPQGGQNGVGQIVMELQANDYIEIGVYQASGGNRIIESGSEHFRSRLIVTKIA